MTYYPSSYDNITRLGGGGAGGTGAASALAQHHSQLLAAAKSDQLERMARDVSDLRYRLSRMEDRFYTPSITHLSIDDEPEPIVEKNESTFWRDLFSDPVWEIFRRPKINP